MSLWTKEPGKCHIILFQPLKMCSVFGACSDKNQKSRYFPDSLTDWLFAFCKFGYLNMHLCQHKQVWQSYNIFKGNTNLSQIWAASIRL